MMSQAGLSPKCQSLQGSVFFWSGRSLYLGQGFDTSVHKPHCAKLCIAVSGSFDLWFPKTGWRTRQAAFIPIGQAHQLRCSGALLAIFRRTPDVREASLLKGAATARVQDDIIKLFKPCLQFYIDHGCSDAEAIQLCDDIESYLGHAADAGCGFDPRIELLLSRLHTRKGAPMCVSDASSLTKLSIGRFSHLFREQLGLPFRRYILGLRLEVALRELSRGTSLTEVAHNAGFADAAHLSRTSRMILGRTPSSLSRHQWSVQP